MSDETQIYPQRVIHFRYEGGVLTACICKECRTDEDGNKLRWPYRTYQRQRRMARKKRRGWA